MHRNQAMAPWRFTLIALALAIGLRLSATASDLAASDAKTAALAKRIDERIADKWREMKLTPAPIADDATLVRRLHLDLGGRIPTSSEARDYLDDSSPDKFERLRDRLLSGPDYVRAFASVWRRALVPEADGDPQVRYIALEFDAWLRKRLAANTPFDEMVRELIMVPLPVNGNQNIFAYASTRRESLPTAFYAAKETKPEGLAAATARLFLAQRLECAECHNHPFADWKREDFWSYAAFFSGIKRSGNGPLATFEELFSGRGVKSVTIAIPDTDQIATARFLDGKSPDLSSNSHPRALLAEWITGKENPYFARAVVNRVWAHFFGEGLVQPIDDMGAGNPPSHPELLDELASGCSESGYDIKFLIGAITSSQAYRLSNRSPLDSTGAEASAEQEADELRFLSRMRVRPMSGEQIYDSLAVAVGLPADDAIENPVQVFMAASPRAKFLDMYRGAEEMPVDQRVSAAQALALMNGSLIAGATSIENSPLLAAMLTPGMTAPAKIEEMFLSTLSRRPTAVEQTWLGEDASDEALADLLWALVNSGEFTLNH